jgi:signal transduction histidine kinase
MDSLGQLLLIYAGVITINMVLSGLLWARYRSPIHRTQFLLWAFSASSAAVQGALGQSPALMTAAFLSTFPINLALADLLGRVVDLRLPWKRYSALFLVGVAGTFAAGVAEARFSIMALPVSCAIAFPLFDSSVRALRAEKPQLTFLGRAAAIVTLVYGVHTVDYAFLRDQPQFGALGFSISLLVIFALSITVPAVVLERITQDRTRVEAVNRFQRQFFANISHDLRTPLTLILAPLESLRAAELGEVPPAHRNYLDAMWKNGIRLLKLIDDLLDLAKLDEGFLRLRVGKTTLEAMLNEVVEHARPLAARKQLSLDLVVKAAPADLWVDVEKMERAVVNLVSNALKFTEAGGVRVELDATADAAVVVVEDTGVGIPPDRQAAIFERFVQADATTSRRFGGSGIGLSFAKEVIELHGGRITVRSEPGKGSRFCIELPLGAGHLSRDVLDRRGPGAAAKGPRRTEDHEPREWIVQLQRRQEYRFSEIGDATERRRVARPSAGRHATRVLLVEDNADVLELITLQLRAEHTVLVAQDGRQGLELALRELPDVVVTDLTMPEMDGLAMLDALRANPRTQSIPVIMLTARNEVEDRLSALKSGADLYLGKPFSPRELSAAVRQMLERRGREVNQIIEAQASSLETISGGLAHEIQNPLNYIKNSQALLVEGLGKIKDLATSGKLAEPAGQALYEKTRDKLERLADNSARGIKKIETTIAQLRRYAREGYPNDPTDLPLDEAVREVAAVIVPKGDDDCSVTLSCEAPGATVRCIPEEMHQVIRNLVQNAVEAAGSGGHVEVRTRAERESVVLEVVDDGPGIAPQDVAKVFAPFYTTKATGMGMGLAVVQQVVTRARGMIEVESVPHKRTTFRLRLPAREGPARAAPGDAGAGRAEAQATAAGGPPADPAATGP